MALSLIAKIRGERVTVGIDVGHYSIKYVKVYHNSRGGKVVVDADLEPVPEGAIVNGEIQRREGGDESQGSGEKKEKDGSILGSWIWAGNKNHTLIRECQSFLFVALL